MKNDRSLTLHSTAVAVECKAVLIVGASGSGKSTLALEMMARGSTLVADDRTILSRKENEITVSCPDALKGLIEARGVGILHAKALDTATLALVVDMDQSETERMPPERTTCHLGLTLPLLHNVASQHFPAAIMQYLKFAGRQ